MRRGLTTFCFLIGWAVALILNGFAQTSAASKPKDAVAVIDGQPVYEDDLLPLVQFQLLQLRNQEYTLKSNALERLINQKLLEAEAKKKGLRVEKLIEQEVDAKVAEPTPAEVAAYYLGQKDKINQPFESVKAQLQQNLRQLKIQQARQDYVKKLRSAAGVTILLRPPKVDVAADPGRLRGAVTSPVKIIEFSDYQCPYCRRVESTLKDLLAKYNGKISLSYRDFPLRDIHPQAELAAEASRCAGGQNKFWEYHDGIYASAKLDKDSLVELAQKLGLDTQEFTGCLSSGKYASEIQKDLEEGKQAGVSGTPAFFINGIFLNGAQSAAAFEKIIDEELAISK